MSKCYMQYEDSCRMREGEWRDDVFFTIGQSQLLGTGKAHICKKCINAYIKDFKVNMDGVIDICRILDLPFIYDAWKESKTFGNYMQRLNKKYASWNFLNSQFPEEELEVKNLSEDEMKQLKRDWGDGYQMEDYIFFHNEYEKLISSYECKDYGTETIFRHIVKIQWDIDRKIKVGDDFDKQLRILNDYLKSANLHPSSKNNQKEGINTLGKTIQKIENERPIPEPSEEFKDVDGIHKYITKYFTTPLKRTFAKDGK